MLVIYADICMSDMYTQHGAGISEKYFVTVKMLLKVLNIFFLKYFKYTQHDDATSCSSQYSPITATV